MERGENDNCLVVFMHFDGRLWEEEEEEEEEACRIREDKKTERKKGG